MKIVNRQAALCVIQRGDRFLVAELIDAQTGAVLHRPVGGGIEQGESPETAVRREVREELGITLTQVKLLGSVDHAWIWKGRELRERAWIFLADASDDARLSRGETVELVEADGDRFQTVWRSAREMADGPPVSPAMLREFLEQIV